MTQQFSIELTTHPRGDEGAWTSLQKASQAAAAGRLNVRVRAWAIDRIIAAGSPRDARQRAEAIYYALVREKIYVSDPVDAELIAGAACTLDKCGDLTFNGGDCDDLVVSLIAALESVGIKCALVAHQYDSPALEHVLVVCHDGARWWYADPAAGYEFGKARIPRREVWVAIPSLRVMCDRAGSCDGRAIAPDVESGRVKGDYLGVGAAPTDGGMTTMSNTLQPVAGRELADLQRDFLVASQALVSARRNMVLEYRRMRAVRDLTGKPPVDTFVYAGVGPAWTQKDDDRVRGLETTCNQAIVYGFEGAKGQRRIERDVVTQQAGVVGLENEPIIYLEDDGSVVLVNAHGVQGARDVIPAGFVSAAPAIAGGIVLGIVISLSVVAIVGTIAVTATAQKYIERVKVKDLIDHQQTLQQKGLKPEQISAMMSSLTDTVERQALAQKEAQKADPLNNLLEVAKIGGVALVGITVVGGAIYAWQQIKPTGSGQLVLAR